ncbi:protein of unknown function [Azospirillum baldaniorum]|uniref:Uncharacterized protein n=1 Tax=Azospirillum baldaniorum TaxID=1064539 RepID=A0A9P1NLK6_9PROT|nr:protein of unknown function [Azospirillum baldaniorum]
MWRAPEDGVPPALRGLDIPPGPALPQGPPPIDQSAGPAPATAPRAPATGLGKACRLHSPLEREGAFVYGTVGGRGPPHRSGHIAGKAVSTALKS